MLAEARQHLSQALQQLEKFDAESKSRLVMDYIESNSVAGQYSVRVIEHRTGGDVQRGDAFIEGMDGADGNTLPGFMSRYLVESPQITDSKCLSMNSGSRSFSYLDEDEDDDDEGENMDPCHQAMCQDQESEAEGFVSAEKREKKKSPNKARYKHVPHREKPPKVVEKRNERERRRVQTVNSAFVKLRKYIPYENRHKRLSKVKTLRKAIEYIDHLRSLIEEADSSTPQQVMPLPLPHASHHAAHHAAGTEGLSDGSLEMMPHSLNPATRCDMQSYTGDTAQMCVESLCSELAFTKNTSSTFTSARNTRADQSSFQNHFFPHLSLLS